MKINIHSRLWMAVVLATVFWNTGCDFGKAPLPSEIRIDSEPSGALLVVNGREAGRTPYLLQQPAMGKYWLQFHKEGFESQDRIMEISSQSPAEILCKLQRQTGLVLFESTPPGAEVSVNGVYKGKTPLLSTDLPSGSYKAVFFMEGYDPREMELVIEDRAPKLCQMNMRSIFATIRVESVPPDAAVMIDGIRKGRTPCSIDDVVVGNHALKVVKDGFKDYQDEIKLTQTGTFPITVKLEERLAVLDITTAPAEARVTVDGEFKGRTPLQVTGLRDGKYLVTIEKPSYETVERPVEIKNAQDAKVDIALQKGTGTLALNILPHGSTVVVDSEIKGVSAEGPFTLDLYPGSYKVEISKAGHRSQSFQAEIRIRKTAARTITLRRVWTKDTVLLLKDDRVREGMVVAKHPNGTIRIETAPGIFEEFKGDEIRSITPINP